MSSTAPEWCFYRLKMVNQLVQVVLMLTSNLRDKFNFYLDYEKYTVRGNQMAPRKY